MAKVVLADLSSISNISVVNENFRKIEDALDKKVLWRDNPDGYPNQMEVPLDMNSNDIINAGLVRAKHIVAESVSSKDKFPIAGGLEDNEMIKWDKASGQLVGTGVKSGKHGEITTANNSVNIGVHDVGSAGRNVVITNRVDNRHFVPVVEEVGLQDEHTTQAFIRDHGNLEELQLYTGMSDILADPTWSTTTQVNRTVLGVKFWPQTDMTNVVYRVFDRGTLIFEENLGDFTAGDNANYKILRTPYDLYNDSDYTFSLSSVDGTTYFKGDDQGKPWFHLQIRPFTFKELATKEDIINSGAGGDMTKAVYDADNDGIVDVAASLEGIGNAGQGKYYGTDFTGNVGFHSIPSGSGGEPSDYQQVKDKVNANTQAINNHSKQIQANLASDQAMQTDIQDIKTELPDIRNELNDATSKIETNILNIKALQKAGKTITFLNKGDSTPQWPSESHGNYILVQKLQTKTVVVETPHPVGGLADGTLFTVFNESPSNSVRVIPKSGSGDTIDSAQAINIPPENFASFVYQLKDKNFLELESGYIPIARVNVTSFVKNSLNSDGLLHTDADIRRLIDTGGYIKGLTVEDTDGNSFPKISRLVFDDLGVRRDPRDARAAHVVGGAGSGGNINVHMAPPNQQYGSATTNEIIVESPLSVFVDPDSTNADAIRFEIEHDAFEPMQAPNFLAYLKEEEKIVGKLPQGLETDAKAHHQGSMWFDDTIHPAGSYIVLNRNDKTFGIQEADDLDPNVSGGTDYLIAARIHMKGAAPSDGMVRLYLYNKSVDPFNPSGYLLDKNGHPMAVERHYKQGQELGVLDIIGIVNAKGLQEFSVHVVDNFQNDFLTITDRTEGASGILIQALKSDSKTGLSLLQFESDTNQNIEFSTHYLGEDRFNLEFLNSRDEPLQTYTVGQNLNLVDGLTLQNRSGIKVGVVNGRTVITDNGAERADFAFGKVFSAEETRMLRGKTVDLTMVTTTHQDASRVFAIKWTGTPDEYTKDFITGWSNDAPTFSTNWSKFDELEIVESAGTEDNITKKTVTIPMDAENYGFIVTPNTGPVSPFKVEIKDLNVDVKPSFIGYSLHASELLNELHLEASKTHSKFIQNTQGNASLRYTINNVADGLPMPVGIRTQGKGPVELDSTINTVSGSGAKGGEGALEFTSDGQANIFVRLRLWNEQSTASQVKFWFVEFDADGNASKLPDSENTFTIPAGAREVIQAFHYVHDFELGDRIGLRASADKADGAFLQCVSDSRPMVEVDVDYTYLMSKGNPGDDPWGSLDMSQFDYVYTHMMAGRLVVKNASSIEVPFVVPENMFIDVKRGIKKLPDGTIRPLKNMDFSYKDDVLRVSFGETVNEARILIGVYL